MLDIKGHYLGLEPGQNKTFYITTCSFTYTENWIIKTILAILLSLFLFQMAFFPSWNKAKNFDYSKHILGMKVGRKIQIFYSILTVFNIVDDWRFLFISNLKNLSELFLYSMTNLVTICYISSDIFTMSRKNFNELISKDLRTLSQFTFYKSKFILLEYVDLQIWMSHETLTK